MEYNASAIETLSFRDAVATRISMYMGSADNQGVLQGIREIITNAIDEYTMGYGNKIEVEIDGNTVKVRDYARGVPFGKRADGTDALEAIYCMAHTGGKFNDKTYQNVAGMNGIGAKGVALSSTDFKAVSCRDGQVATLILKDGIKVSLTTRAATKMDKQGTYVEYTPSQSVYNVEPIHIDFEEVKKMCRDWSYLCKGLEFNLTNAQTGEKVRYLSNNGLLDFMRDNAGRAINKTPLSIQVQEGDIHAEIVMEWTDSRVERAYVFTNGLENPELGTSATGAKTALTNFFKKRLKGEVSPDTLRKGLFYAISCQLPNPSFSDQRKGKVNNIELRGICQRATTQMLEDFEMRHRDEFEKILEMLSKEAKAEIAAERARRQVLETAKDISNDKKKRKILADKLKDCQIHGPNSGSVLGICEGDSALGALVQARPIDKVALMPIRGKIISALKNPQEKILQNEEVKAIFSALGCGFLNNYNSSKLRYQYVAICSDGDVDGSSIANLITTLFFYMCPKFIEEGRLFRAKMPLFVLEYSGNKRYYAFSGEERDELIKKYGKPKSIGRKKGIGENTPQETEEAVFGEQRRWERVNIKDFDEYANMMNMLMGPKVDDRRDFIMKNVDFSNISE